MLAKVPDDRVDEFMPITELEETLLSVDSDDYIFSDDDDDEPASARGSNASQRMADTEIRDIIELEDGSSVGSSGELLENEENNMVEYDEYEDGLPHGDLPAIRPDLEQESEESEGDSIPIQSLNWDDDESDENEEEKEVEKQLDVSQSSWETADTVIMTQPVPIKESPEDSIHIILSDSPELDDAVGAEVTVVTEDDNSSESIPDIDIIDTEDEDGCGGEDFTVSSSYNMDNGASNANQIIRPYYSDTPTSQQSQPTYSQFEQNGDVVSSTEEIPV